MPVEHESRTWLGEMICEEAGVMERCAFHDEVAFLTGNDETDAYVHAAKLIREGDPRLGRLTRRQVTDAVKAALGQCGIFECPADGHYE